jgi:hypothetical protein
LTEYFNKYGFSFEREWVIENKVLHSEYEMAELQRKNICPDPAPPWRIGWYGHLRCEKSFDILLSLARRLEGVIEISMRGRTLSPICDREKELNNYGNIRYGGLYDRATDLPALYSAVHFAWAIDLTDEGHNSAWLLPNRIYESTLFGTVPIALSSVETGRWLAKREVGVLADHPILNNLEMFFRTLTRERFDVLRQQSSAVSRSDLVASELECRELVEFCFGIGKFCRI